MRYDEHNYGDFDCFRLKRFSITEKYLMELFNKEFYSNYIDDYKLKTCNFYIKTSNEYSFGHHRMDCDFKDRCFVDFMCTKCGREITGIYKESNYSFKLRIIIDSFGILTCEENLIKGIIE